MDRNNTNLEIVVQGTIWHEFDNNHQGWSCYKKERKERILDKLSRSNLQVRESSSWMFSQLNLLLVTTPSRKMTFGSQNCPIIEASAMKSWRFFRAAAGWGNYNNNLTSNKTTQATETTLANTDLVCMFLWGHHTLGDMLRGHAAAKVFLLLLWKEVCYEDKIASPQHVAGLNLWVMKAQNDRRFQCRTGCNALLQTVAATK